MFLIRSMAIAFSIYSKIPMPQFEWKEKEMKYELCFFPFVGIVIGLTYYGWSILCTRYQVGTVCYALIGAAIPLLISGGFHLDGYMDTSDAFHSYQPRERKLEILKDSHVGAFAVIRVILYYLIYVGALSEVQGPRYTGVLAFGFFFGRVLSGIGVVTFRSAKKEGLLYTFASQSHRKIVAGTLYVELVAGAVLLFIMAPLLASLSLGMGGMIFAYYRFRSYKELGGITGDTAGWFVTLFELGFVVAVAFGRWFGL